MRQLPANVDPLLDHLERGIVALNDEDFDRYWIAFGRFIIAYARTEHELLRLLRHFSEIKDETAAVVFAGTRMDAAKRHIYSILEARKMKRVSNRLKRALDHFGTINTIRNNMLHWEISPHNENTLTISNAFLRPRREKIRKYRISTADMESMRADLNRIALWLWLIKEETKFDAVIRRYLGRPWQYKLPQPSSRAKKGRGHHQSPSQN